MWKRARSQRSLQLMTEKGRQCSVRWGNGREEGVEWVPPRMGRSEWTEPCQASGGLAQVLFAWSALIGGSTTTKCRSLLVFCFSALL